MNTNIIGGFSNFLNDNRESNIANSGMQIRQTPNSIRRRQMNIRRAFRERLRNEHSALMEKAKKFADDAKKRVIDEKNDLKKLQQAGALKLSKESILSENAKTAAAFSILNKFYEETKKSCRCPFSLCLANNPVVDIYGDIYSKEGYENYKRACKEKVDYSFNRPIRHDPVFTFPDSPLNRLPMLGDPKESNVVKLIVDKLNEAEKNITVNNPTALRKNVESFIDLYNYIADIIYDYRTRDMTPNIPVKNIIENISKVADTEIICPKSAVSEPLVNEHSRIKAPVESIKCPINLEECDHTRLTSLHNLSTEALSALEEIVKAVQKEAPNRKGFFASITKRNNIAFGGILETIRERLCPNVYMNDLSKDLLSKLKNRLKTLQSASFVNADDKKVLQSLCDHIDTLT